jgi:hypothetical protein
VKGVGGTMKRGPKPRTLADLIARHYIPEPMSGCWLWIGARRTNGYGVIGVLPRGLMQAHRAVWTALVGSVPDGMNVLHRCDNRACVNPDHLWLGTQGENLRDAWRKGRFASQLRANADRSRDDLGRYAKGA